MADDEAMQARMRAGMSNAIESVAFFYETYRAEMMRDPEIAAGQWPTWDGLTGEQRGRWTTAFGLTLQVSVAVAEAFRLMGESDG